ncbi:hypothetical protein SD81_016550 [Tolypothrix campylonemoides VB511288]|nr:hypothetical protein SD81_016550 [Tolypothrix campylonemoides VB511288]
MHARHRTTLAAAVLLGLAPTIAVAAEEDTPFTVRLGAMYVDGSGDIEGRTNALGQDFAFTEDFDFGSREVVPRVDGQFRFGGRSRIVFNYFEYDKDNRQTLSEAISFDDVTIPAGSFAETQAEFQLASIAYDFAVIETDTASLGLQVGAEYAKLEGRLIAEAGADRYDETATEDGYAPLVGIRYTATPGDAWRVVAQAQYFDSEWGDFGDVEGDVTRANALVEYRFNPTFGLFAGYDWFEIDARESGSDGSLRLKQRFHGPIAGVSLSF